MIELQATTPQGQRLVALAESLATRFAERADGHDRGGTFHDEAVEDLAASRYFTAPVPEEFGGLGVASVHDLIVASSRLARGDASVAIGVNMHLLPLLNTVRGRELAIAKGNERSARALTAALEQIVRDGVVLAAAVSEPAQDLTRPATIAARSDTGWRVTGRKIFCTLSPAATVLYTAVTFVDDEGAERYGYAMIPATSPGVTIHGDWDGLGMRASGSHTVSFDDVVLPPSALRRGFPVGDATAFIRRNLSAGLFHASASLGIAESANGLGVERMAARNGHADARGRALIAENAIELAAGRGVLARAAGLIDAHFVSHTTDDGTPQELAALFAEAQAAKTFVNEAATRVVDRALELSGGAGYVNGNPIARAVRDVRAGAFMNPLATSRAYEYLARSELGQHGTMR
jgi:alkylation response protein AidB-like acyl-CoA dehydrogenase